MIERFMQKWEASRDVEEKVLRESPAKVERMEFANSKRDSKRRGGFRWEIV